VIRARLSRVWWLRDRLSDGLGWIVCQSTHRYWWAKDFSIPGYRWRCLVCDRTPRRLRQSFRERWK